MFFQHLLMMLATLLVSAYDAWTGWAFTVVSGLCAGKVLGMPAAKVKQCVQATRDQKSLDAPLFKNNSKNQGVGESLVDTVAAEDSDDEDAVEHARCVRMPS